MRKRLVSHLAVLLLFSSSVISTPYLPIIAATGSEVGGVQELSHDEARKEAGRLATEAFRIQGEAYKQLQSGGDRKLLDEALKASIERFRRALELWRTAGDFARLTEGAEELSRLYTTLKDYENAVNCLKREYEFWQARGDVPRQVRMLNQIGGRQMQLRGNDAIKTLEQVVEMSRAAKLLSEEAGALQSLAMIFERSGRKAEAEKLEARARELSFQLFNSQAQEQKPRQPMGIPEQWLDLPSAPLVAEYRDVEGVRQAVLVNRSSKGIEFVFFGCAKEQDRKAYVIGELVGMGQNHGGVSPNYYYESFKVLNGPLNQWTDEKMGCEKNAKMVVIRAIFADRTEWKADGTEWIER